MELLTESQYNKLSLEEKIEYEEVEVENTLASVNIHVLLSKETLSQCWQVLYDSLNHKIPGLNAVVFLSLKRMGRGVNMHSVSQEDFKALIDFALDNNINVGFDSCGCNKFLKAIESR